MIREKCYGKVNLILKVIGKKEDGYHEIHSLMTPISLHDTITISKLSTKEIVIKGMDLRDNIMYDACKYLMDKYNTGGVSISINKRIPLQAGLGGGSSDCAGALRGMARLYKLPVSLDELASLGLMFGADVPFCVHSRAAWVRGVGEELSFLEKPFAFPIGLIKPSFGLSTKTVFVNVVRYSEDIEEFEIDSVEHIASLLDNDLWDVASKIEARLHELFIEGEKEGIKLCMSGSGTTLFAIGESYERLLVSDFSKVYENRIIISECKNKFE